MNDPATPSGYGRLDELPSSTNLDAEAWALRHEANTLSTFPEPALILDYAGAAQKVTRGMFHLDEALPAGQTERITLAYRLLRSGCDELGVWLRERGVKV